MVYNRHHHNASKRLVKLSFLFMLNHVILLEV